MVRKVKEGMSFQAWSEMSKEVTVIFFSLSSLIQKSHELRDMFKTIYQLSEVSI